MSKFSKKFFITYVLLFCFQLFTSSSYRPYTFRMAFASFLKMCYALLIYFGIDSATCVVQKVLFNASLSGSDFGCGSCSILSSNKPLNRYLYYDHKASTGMYLNLYLTFKTSSMLSSSIKALTSFVLWKPAWSATKYILRSSLALSRMKPRSSLNVSSVIAKSHYTCPITPWQLQIAVDTACTSCL